MITIGYMLEHPEEFDKDSKVLILSKETLNKIDAVSSAPKSKKSNNPLTQFELYGPDGETKPKAISISDYEMLKKLTKLTKEGVNISYWSDICWFVTRSQKTLDKVNAYFGTDFRFDWEHRVDYSKRK